MAVALVTGANGFLGRYVTQEIQSRGDQVIALTRGSSIKGHPGLPLSMKPTVQEVRNLLDETDAAFVYHLAGTSDASSLETLYQANVIYAQTILSGAALAKSPPKIVLIGSAAEYGNPIALDGVTREEDLCSPVSAYGISKLAQTHHGMAASANGQSVAVARLFNPIGAGSPSSTALGSFVRQIAAMDSEGGVLRTGPLHSVRDFIDVSEAARIIAELPLHLNFGGKVYNVCTGTGIKLLDIVSLLIETAEVRVEHHVEGHIRGTSDIDTVIGSNERLRTLGLSVSKPDLNALLARMLLHEREISRKLGM
jgi:GDP-4-dehydro-6-deoxy-D-mannose reductase